jgi:PhnB protein
MKLSPISNLNINWSCIREEPFLSIAKGVTTVIGLFVPDVDKVMEKGIRAGATEISPAKDYEYGYRQCMFKDPFGHYWQIQKKLS